MYSFFSCRGRELIAYCGVPPYNKTIYKESKTNCRLTGFKAILRYEHILGRDGAVHIGDEPRVLGACVLAQEAHPPLVKRRLESRGGCGVRVACEKFAEGI